MTNIVYQPPKGTRVGTRFEVEGLGTVRVERFVNMGRGRRVIFVDKPMDPFYFVPHVKEVLERSARLDADIRAAREAEASTSS